ncbi:MAG: ribose 5-phosphate isomerase B [Bacteroidota bacterium]
MSDLVIAMASDHAGFTRKQAIIRYFQEKGIKFHDFGCYSEESCDYPEFAHTIATAISNGEYPFGITFCGSGQGISITANKHQKIRSALCWNAEIARLAKEHNDANICAIPGRFVTDEEAIAIVEAYLNATFEGGRHQRRIDLIPVSDCC